MIAAKISLALQISFKAVKEGLIRALPIAQRDKLIYSAVLTRFILFICLQ